MLIRSLGIFIIGGVTLLFNSQKAIKNEEMKSKEKRTSFFEQTKGPHTCPEQSNIVVQNGIQWERANKPIHERITQIARRKHMAKALEKTGGKASRHIDASRGKVPGILPHIGR